MTGVSACVSVLGTITHSLCICHLAIKLYCIVLYCSGTRMGTMPRAPKSRLWTGPGFMKTPALPASASADLPYQTDRAVCRACQGLDGFQQN